MGIFRMTKPVDPGVLEELAAQDSRWKYLPRHGNFSLAYSTLDRDLRSFELPGKGYIAYASIKPDPAFPETTLAFADPVCAPADRKELLGAFIEQHRDVGGKAPGFIQVGRGAAQDLSDLGQHITQFGIETNVPTRDYKVSGTDKERLRKSLRIGRDAGYTISELEPAHGNGPVYERLKEISDAWIKTHVVDDREIKFLTRQAVYDDEPLARKLLLRNSKGEIEGFSVYDPVFEHGDITAYSPSITRMLPSTFKGAAYFINLEAMPMFANEGVETLALSVSPCYKLQPVPASMRADPETQKMFERLYQESDVYSFQGLAQFKRKYRGEEFPTYAAFPTKMPLQHLLTGFKLAGLKVPTLELPEMPDDW